MSHLLISVNFICISAFYSIALFFALNSTSKADSVLNSDSSIKVHFGPVDQGSVETDLGQKFIKFIEKAETTIDGAFYEFRDNRIIDALLSAHKRSVKVRLLVDSDHFFLRDPETLEIDYNRRNKYIKRLLDAGIDVREDEKRSGLMHNKFCVVDHNAIWTGSFNLTTTGSQRNENNALQFQSIKLARIFLREFNEMYEDRRFGITSPSTPNDQSIDFGGRKVEVYFAPEDNPLGRIYQHVSQAQQGVYFMQFAMTANELGNLLIKQHDAGIEVKGIFDKVLYRSTGPYAEFSKLTRNGVPVIVYDSELQGKLHHKVFIIDPNGTNPKVITGSMNASSNGNYTNDENIIIIEDREIAQTYYKVFRDLFGRTSRVTASFKTMKPLRVNTIVPRLSLMVSSNGVRTEKLNIQFPARWPNQNQDLKLKVYRMRQGTMIDTTSQENLIITSKNMYLNSANLTAAGESAMLMIRMSNILTPEIPGMYNLYIKAKSKYQGYYPLKTQPTMRILGIDENPDNEDENLIFTKLQRGNYNYLDRLIQLCYSENECERFTGRLMTQSSQILRQKILVENDPAARNMLEALKQLDREVLMNFRAERLDILKSNTVDLPKID